MVNCLQTRRHIATTPSITRFAIEKTFQTFLRKDSVPVFRIALCVSSNRFPNAFQMLSCRGSDARVCHGFHSRVNLLPRNEKFQGGVSRLITQKSTAFMGKEAEPSVELCCAAKARSYSGEKCRGGKTVPTKSKNQNKLPKDSTECQTDLSWPDLLTIVG